MIYLAFGCVSSGKTTELIRQLERQQIAGKRCILIRWIGDTREFKHRIPDGCVVKIIDSLGIENVSEMESYDVVGIDEGQFLGSGLTEFCEAISLMGKYVVVAALDMYWNGKQFENTSMLICRAEFPVKFLAVCTLCGSEHAMFSKRLNSSTELVDIGGADKYAPRCRQCFML